MRSIVESGVPLVKVVLLGWPTLAAAPYMLVGQELHGTLRDASVGDPIAGAVVELVNSAGDRVDAALSGDTGGFRLIAGGTGLYTVRVQRIGFETWQSPEFDVPDSTIRRTFRIPVEPVPMESIAVQGDRICRNDPEEVRRALALMEEIAPQLREVARAETEGLFLYQVEVSETGPTDAGACGPLSDEYFAENPHHRPGPARTAMSPTPLATLGAADLASEGFARLSDAGDQLMYYGLTAEVLLSRAFQESHCLTATEDQAGNPGVRFSPVPGTDHLDVEGVIWIDAATGRVRDVRFQYVNLRPLLDRYERAPLVAEIHEAVSRDPRVAGGYRLELGSTRMEPEFGGHLVFDYLQPGLTITREWELIIPLMTYCAQLQWQETPAPVTGTVVTMLRRRTGRVTGVIARTGRPNR